MILETTFTIQIARLKVDDYHTRRTFRMAPDAPLPKVEYLDSPHQGDAARSTTAYPFHHKAPGSLY